MILLTYSYSTTLRLLVALSFLTSSIRIASAASIPTNSSTTHMNVTPPPPSDSLSLIPASRHQQDDDKGTPIRLAVALHFEPPRARDDHSHDTEFTSGVCMIIGNHAIAWDHTAVPKDYKLHLSELDENRHFGYYSAIGDIDLYTHTMENFPKSILDEIETEARETQQKSEDGDPLTEGFNHLDSFMNLLISGKYHVDVPERVLENYKLLMSMYRSIAKPGYKESSQYLGLVADMVFNVHPYRNNRKVSKEVDMTIGRRIIPAPPPSSSSNSDGSSNLRIGSYDSAGYGRKRLGFIHFYGNPEEILRQVEERTPEIEGRDKKFAKAEFLEDFMLILGVARDVTVFEVVVQQWSFAVANYRQALDTWRSRQRIRDAERRNWRQGHRTIH
ncbi:hypothetical protein EV360DRAFT_80084 [Lentinula raphanica]|nr:hypothetical protein EV360DRAFT_80084 [Lentinula raphanica]